MSLRPSTTSVLTRLRRLALIPLAAIGLVLGLAVAPNAQAAVLFGDDISWPQCPATFPPTSTQFVVIGLTNGLPFTQNPCVAGQAAWAQGLAKPTHAYTMAGFPTSTQLTTHRAAGPWSSATRGGQLSNVGYAEARYAVTTVRSVAGWQPRMIWIDVEPRDIAPRRQPWPTRTALQRLENRYVIEGIMRGLRDSGFSYGLYSNASGWQSITGSWRLPGVPVWATAGLLDYPNEALDRCTQASFSGGPVYLSQWWLDATRDFDRTCGTYQLERLPVPPSSLSNTTADFNGDWNNDVLARWTNGTLRFYAGNGRGSIATSVQVGSGWGVFNAIDTVGDTNGDGAQDVVARVSSTGDLRLYKGNGRGGWLLPPTVVGRGWNIFNAVLGVGDLDGDQRPDLIARRTSDGTLYRYSGTGTGGWRAAVLVGRGWNVMSALVGAGDVNGDGRADLVARERATGHLWLYPGNGTGGFTARVRIGTGWNGLTAIVGAGDLNGDRVVDLLARDAAGTLWLYPRTAAGAFSARVRVSTGWNIANAIF
jgi:hypothetical protein